MTIKLNKLPSEQDSSQVDSDSNLNVITTSDGSIVEELKKEWTESWYDYNQIPHIGKIKYQYTDEEHDDSEDEELSISEMIRKKPSIISSRIKAPKKDFILLDNYLDTNNLYSLLKHLIRSGYLSETSNCFNSVIPISDNPLIEISDRLRGRIIKDSKELLSNLKVYDFPSMESPTRVNLKTFGKDLETIITNIYTTPANLKMIFFVNSQEELNHVIKECILRNIEIDTELINNSIDFTFLRNKNATVKLALIKDQLILINDCYYFLYGGSSIYNTFADISPSREISESSTEDDVISINGEKYSKRLVEGMLECKIETLITNLQIEKYLQETESKRTGDGSNDSLQDIKLF